MFYSFIPTAGNVICIRSQSITVIAPRDRGKHVLVFSLYFTTHVFLPDGEIYIHILYEREKDFSQTLLAVCLPASFA